MISIILTAQLSRKENVSVKFKFAYGVLRLLKGTLRNTEHTTRPEAHFLLDFGYPSRRGTLRQIRMAIFSNVPRVDMLNRRTSFLHCFVK